MHVVSPACRVQDISIEELESALEATALLDGKKDDDNDDDDSPAMKKDEVPAVDNAVMKKDEVPAENHAHAEEEGNPQDGEQNMEKQEESADDQNGVDTKVRRLCMCSVSLHVWPNIMFIHQSLCALLCSLCNS